MTINARSEMDLDEDTVLEKVSKASGTPRSSCQICASLCVHNFTSIVCNMCKK